MYLNGQLYLEPVTTIANQMVMMTLPRFKKSAYNFQEWKDMYKHVKVVSFMLIEKKIKAVRRAMCYQFRH